MPTAGSIADEAAALCGDRNKNLYTFERVLPLLNRALRRFSSILTENGVSVTRDEEHISNTIASGIKEHPNPPTDLITPIALWERPDGSSSDQDWVPMTEDDWDPADLLGETLGVWKWTGEKVTFRGATTANKVLMKYNKSLIVVINNTDNIAINDCASYLASKTAEYAARYIGKNTQMADGLRVEATDALNEFLNMRTREVQSNVARMKPYSAFRR